jgi:hypothetical protein
MIATSYYAGEVHKLKEKLTDSQFYRAFLVRSLVKTKEGVSSVFDYIASTSESVKSRTNSAFDYALNKIASVEHVDVKQQQN